MAMQKTDRSTVFTSLFWRFAERVGAQGVAFVVSIVLGRLLDPELYGTIALIMVYTAIMNVFVDSGLGNALVQKKNADDLDFSSVFYFNVAACCVLYAIMFFAAPFIVMRHWADIHQDGQYWSGKFETDEVDWRLTELLVNIQYACQRHYFGTLAEKYFDDKTRDAAANVQRRAKTVEAFNRLPEEFTTDDLMQCFNLKTISSARVRVFRLLKDGLIEKMDEYVENGTTRAKYKKTGAVMI